MKKFLAILATLMLVAVSGSAQRAAELYAVVDTGTVTVYYDQNSPGIAYHLEDYVFDKYEFSRVILDSSLRNYYPKSCKGWFKGSEFLEEISGLEYLNTDSVTDMSEMFMGCKCLKVLDLSGFNTSNVTDMSRMFYGCTSLTTIFAKDDFDTAALQKSDSIFFRCYNLYGGKGSRVNYPYNYDASSLRIDGGKENIGFFTMKGQEPFKKSASTSVYKRKMPTTKEYAVLKDSTLTLYYGGIKPSDSTVYTIGDYGNDCSKIAYVVFDKSFKNFYPKTCARWFDGLINLKEIRGMKEYLNTQYVVYMDYMFSGCQKIEHIDVGGFDTHCTKYMGAMFNGCKSLKSLDVNSFYTANVYDMSMMFYHCESLDTLDLSSFNTAKVKWFNFMFEDCTNLKTILVSDSWSIKNAADCRLVFGGCDNLRGGEGCNHKYDVKYAQIDGKNGKPGLLTKKGHPYLGREYAVLQNTTLIFYYGDNKPQDTEIYYPGFYGDIRKTIRHIVIDTSFRNFAPKYCNDWFAGCENLLDITGLENINTQNVVDMSHLFQYCHSLKTIYAGENWNTESVKDSEYMFWNCSNLIGGEGSKCRGYWADTLQYAHIDGGEANSGYFTKSGQKPYGETIIQKDTSYTVFKDEILTFYYGKPQFVLDKYDKWYVKKIVFDSTYKNYYPKTCKGFFSGCRNLEEIVGMDQYLNTDSVENMSQMFYICRSLKKLDLSNFKTDKVTDMKEMFLGCDSLTGLNLSSFNTEKVTNMGGMFRGCKTLKNIDLSNFKTDNVTDMHSMFSGCRALNDLDVSYFTTSKVANMSGMFRGCCRLKNIDITNFKTDSLTNVSFMFSGCLGLTQLDLHNFNTENIKNMGGMFRNCNGLTELNLEFFDTKNVEDMGDMFADCSNLKTIYVSDKWSVASLDSTKDNISYEQYWCGELYHEGGNGCKYMFDGCGNLVGGGGTTFNRHKAGKEYARIDGGTSAPGYLTAKGSKISKKQAYAVLKNNTLTFYYGNKQKNVFNLNCNATPEWSNLAQTIHKVVFDKSFRQYKPTSCYEWFFGCCNLTEIVGMKENLNTVNVSDMGLMFFACVNLRDIDLSGFNTSNVVNMVSMFGCCTGLETLNLKSFDTQNVKTMAMMFENCENIQTLDLSSFNTQNVTNMNSMFYNCKNLKTINLKSFNTTNTVGMEHLFGNCISLTDIDLSNFDLSYNNESQRRHLNFMFENCIGLKSIDMGNLTNVHGNFTGMFFGCENLENLNLFHPLCQYEDYYEQYVHFNMCAMFYGCKKLKTIDLSDFIVKECPYNLAYTFANCTNLRTIYVSGNWALKYVDTMENEDWDGSITVRYVFDSHNFVNVFKNCPNLVGGNGTKWDEKNVSNEQYLRIDCGSESPGYFTKK